MEQYTVAFFITMRVQVLWAHKYIIISFLLHVRKYAVAGRYQVPLVPLGQRWCYEINVMGTNNYLWC